MQADKSNMSKRQFRIGDLAQELKVKKFVIRFWEKEFDIQSDRSQGGQRFYTDDDLKTFMTIKDLLYNQKFTIAGAKKQLEDLKRSGGGVVTNMDVAERLAVYEAAEEFVASTPSVDNAPEAAIVQEAAMIPTATQPENHVTPATKAPTLDDSVLQQLREFKERLLAFKNKVERLQR